LAEATEVSALLVGTVIALGATQLGISGHTDVAQTVRSCWTPAPNMPEGKTSKTQTKADFVRSIPSTTSAADVVAKAKDAGMKLSTHYVHNVRTETKAKSKAKQKSTSGKPNMSRTSKKTANKAAFVRGLPLSTPAKQVVTLAKAAGMKLGINYVYNIRGTAKLAAKKKRAAAKSPVASTVANTGSWSVSQHAETLLRAVAAEIGLGQAIELLLAERTRVHSLLRE